jgi:hypothetical protein
MMGKTIHLATQIGMGADKTLYLQIRDSDHKIVAEVSLSGNDVLHLVSGGSIECSNRLGDR